MQILFVIMISIISYIYTMDLDYDSWVNLSDSTESSHEQQINNSKKTLKDIDPLEWKANITTLDLAKKELTSVADFKNYCQPSLLSEPPLFPYKTITKIMLQNNALKKIEGGWFAACEDLRYLDISHNKIKKLDLGSLFNACPRLKYIDASYNASAHKSLGVSWSEHSVWRHLAATKGLIFNNSLPIINLNGNNIGKTDQQWVIERYHKEMERLIKTNHIMPDSIVGAIIGTTIIGGGTLPLTLMINPYASIATIGGCIIGTLMGSRAIFCIENIIDHYYIKDRNIPILFDGSNTNAYTDAHENKDLSDQLNPFRINICL